jgi:fatty acid-binding protein DegV
MYSSAIEGRGMFLEQNLNTKLNIHIIDTHTYSMGTGMIVLAAKKSIEQGKSVYETLSLIDDLVNRVEIMVNSFSIKNLPSDTALDWIKKFTSGIAHPFPTLQIVNSEAQELPIKKGDHTAFDQFFDYCIKALKGHDTEYYIGYTLREKEASALSMVLEKELGVPPQMIYKLGGFSSYCNGRAAITITYLGKSRKV